MRCVKGWRRVTPGKSCKPHPLMTWQGMAAGLGFPQVVIYIMISVVGYLRPSKVLRPHANHMLPPSAGVRLFWSLLLHPEEGLQRSKKDLTTNRSCWTSPYVVSWKGPVLKALAEGHPDGHLFEINDTDFL